MSSAKQFLFIVLTFALHGIANGQSCAGLGSQDFSDIIYVSVTGSSAAQGTTDDPTDLLTAIGMLGGNSDKIYMQSGTYVLSNALNMPSDAQIIGGFNTDWVKDNTGITTIFRDPNNSQTGPPRLIAIQCIGQSNFRLQDLTIRTSGALGQGVTTYGLYLNNCADYNIVRCDIIAGNGGHGNPGGCWSTRPDRC